MAPHEQSQFMPTNSPEVIGSAFINLWSLRIRTTGQRLFRF